MRAKTIDECIELALRVGITIPKLKEVLRNELKDLLAHEIMIIQGTEVHPEVTKKLGELFTKLFIKE